MPKPLDKIESHSNVKNNRNFVNILATLIIWIGLPSQLLGQDFDIVIKPTKIDSFKVAKFSIYVPEDVRKLNGILHWVYPQNADGREISQDTVFRKFCNRLGFALIGSQIDSRQLENGLGNAYINTIDSVSRLSDHPELKFAPIFFYGYSWGGQWAYDFAIWKPDRVIGLITQKGGYHDSTAANGIINIPVYMFVGELDKAYRINNLTGIFKENRSKGAPWVLAIDSNKGHTPVLDKDILLPYIETITTLRLPHESANRKEIVLRQLDLKKGWEGNLRSKEIGKYGTLSGKPEELVWLPDRENALIWQKFIKEDHK